MHLFSNSITHFVLRLSVTEGSSMVSSCFQWYRWIYQPVLSLSPGARHPPWWEMLFTVQYSSNQNSSHLHKRNSWTVLWYILEMFPWCKLVLLNCLKQSCSLLEQMNTCTFILQRAFRPDDIVKFCTTSTKSHLKNKKCHSRWVSC